MSDKHNKNHEKLARSQLRQLTTVWIFLILAIITGVVALESYVGNSKEAKHRYDQLIAVDAAGGDVEKSLLELRSYIYSHMNTTIGSPNGVRPPIQLKGTYDRLVAAEQARVKSANDDLYNSAQKICEKLYPTELSGRSRVPCITEYVTKNSVKANSIPDGLYKFDFVSPAWSFDTAGISMVLTALFASIFLYRLSLYQWIRHQLHAAL